MPLWLFFGVYMFPLLFCWFTLRRGYSSHVRLGAFLLAGLTLGAVIAAMISPS